MCILLLTYNRLEYAKRTITSALRRVKTKHDLFVHIASDGDTDEYIEALKLATVHAGPCIEIDVSNSQRSGYGANYNLATQTVHQYADYVLVLEDDWELTRDLDLDIFIGTLEELQAGCMRLGYVGFTQPLRGEFAASHGRHWLRLDPSSPEPHVFAGHPRIESVAWERNVGPWPEGLLPGETEFSVAHIPASRFGVVWPVQEIKTYGDMFVHIGAERAW